jgi:quercetin dioxygenase-like cupin family protein
VGVPAGLNRKTTLKTAVHDKEKTMRKQIAVKAALITTVLVALACGLSWATQGSGTSSTPLGRARFKGPLSVVRHGAKNWVFGVDSRPAVDVATQVIVFEPGGQSGWHSHPGPVFISVVKGTMTFYESHDPDCTPIVRHAGEGFLDTGDHAHIARNESDKPAMNVVTYFLPPDAKSLRKDEAAPGNCPF